MLSETLLSPVGTILISGAVSYFMVAYADQRGPGWKALKPRKRLRRVLGLLPWAALWPASLVISIALACSERSGADADD